MQPGSRKSKEILEINENITKQANSITYTWVSRDRKLLHHNHHNWEQTPPVNS